jgi:2-keto-4-pentenoate hydratase/2-oxohepta-3-ene-1,7-dioic acid hydratase in catechol pathway
MRFATVEHKGKTFVGVVDEAAKSVTALMTRAGAEVYDINEVIRSEGRFDSLYVAKGPTFALSALKLKAPIPVPVRNIMCVGKNYREHAREFAASGFDSSASGAADAIPTAPIIFTKVPQSVIGPEEPILYPTGVSEQLDYEAELAIIIGKPGRGIPLKSAMQHVWGYTIVNDVTARDLQARHKQWFLGKSMDTFAPMGPWCVTADEVDLGAGGIRCWVNGELR